MSAVGAGAGEFPVGTRIKVTGLTSEKGKQMNDKEGTIAEPLVDGRYGVRLDSGEEARMKPVNIIAVKSAAPLKLFATHESFETYTEPGPEVKGYTTRVFKGEPPFTMYRGDRTMLDSGEVVPDAKPGSTKVPLFLGDLESIRIYARIPPGSGKPDPRAISRYIFKGRPTLFEMSAANLEKLLTEPDIEPEFKDLYFAYVKPSQFPKVPEQPPTDLLVDAVNPPLAKGYPVVTPNLQSLDSKLPNIYFNRMLADILCKKGFDGWVLLPGTLLQRFPLRSYAMNPAQYIKDLNSRSIKFFYTPHPPEVMLCKWDSFAAWEKMSKGGRRKTRRRRRSSRHRV